MARKPSSIGLALEVLEHVARAPDGVSANEIARLIGVPRATVYRIVNSLVEDEFLLRRPDLRGFALGARVVELAHLVAVPDPSPRDELIAALRDEVGEAIHLTVFDGTRVRLLDEDPARPIADPRRFAVEPVSSAVGHLLLAELSPARAVALAEARPEHVEDLVEAVRVRGYGQQIGLVVPDRACLAVAIRSADGRLLGALALATSVSRISTAVRHLERLRVAADALAAGDVLESQL